jgi:hypothetical protein
MVEIHCHVCGGFISDSAVIAYRLPLDTGHSAAPRSALCDCQPPVVYAAPPGHMSSPGMPAAARVSR